MCGALVLGSLLCGSVRAATAPASPEGNWLTQDRKGVIFIAKCGAAFCGDIIGVTDFGPDGSPPRDTKGVSDCHLRIVRDMVPAEDGRFQGTITNPRNGNVYHANMWVADDGTLRLRGYVLLPMFGETQTWTPFAGKPTPDCHFSLK